jgi:hypothetical protein
MGSCKRVKLARKSFCAARAPAQYGRWPVEQKFEVTSASGSGAITVENGWAGADRARTMSGAALKVLYVGVASKAVNCSNLGHAVFSESVRGRKYGRALSKGCESDSGVSWDEDEDSLTGMSTCGMAVFRETGLSCTVSCSMGSPASVKISIS